jgi:hypothetical protein
VLKHAFKEWAVICAALAQGRQALILRKGGVAESAGEFQVEHTKFWLFPTYVHQQQTGIKPEAAALLNQVEHEKPPKGTIRFSHLAMVAGVYHLRGMVGALLLREFHLWSDETIQARFAYRSPGLYVLLVRVYRAPQLLEVPDTARYAGCRSWVELENDLPTEGAVPVLSDEAFGTLIKRLDVLLHPTAIT